MATVARIIEFAKAKPWNECALCHQFFADHFQPPPDADLDRAANWCPAIARPGFTSMCFKKSEVKREQ